MHSRKSPFGTQSLISVSFLAISLLVGCAQKDSSFSGSTKNAKAQFSTKDMFTDNAELNERYEDEIQIVLESDLLDVFKKHLQESKVGSQVVEVDGIEYENIEESLAFSSEYLENSDLFAGITYGEFLEGFGIETSRLETIGDAQDLISELNEEVVRDSDHVYLPSSEDELLEFAGLDVSSAEEDDSFSLLQSKCWAHVQKAAAKDGTCGAFKSAQEFMAGSKSGEAKRLETIRQTTMKNGGPLAAELAVAQARQLGQQWHTEQAQKAAAKFLAEGNTSEAKAWSDIAIQYSGKSSQQALGVASMAAQVSTYAGTLDKVAQEQNQLFHQADGTLPLPQAVPY